MGILDGLIQNPNDQTYALLGALGAGLLGATTGRNPGQSIARGLGAGVSGLYGGVQAVQNQQKQLMENQRMQQLIDSGMTQNQIAQDRLALDRDRFNSEEKMNQWKMNKLQEEEQLARDRAARENASFQQGVQGLLPRERARATEEGAIFTKPGVAAIAEQYGTPTAPIMGEPTLAERLGAIGQLYEGGEKGRTIAGQLLQDMNKPSKASIKEFIQGDKTVYKRVDEEGNIVGDVPDLGGPRYKPNAGGIGVGMTFGDKELIRTTMRQLPQLKKDAITQSNNVSNIDRALDFVKTGVTGKGGQVKAFLAPYAEMLGMDTQNMNDSQTFQLLTRVIVGPMRLDIVGPGPVSEWEQKLMQQISGGGGAGRSAALELLNNYRRQAISRVDNYNSTLEGIAGMEPNVDKVYKRIEIPSRQATGQQDTGNGNATSSGNRFTVREVK